MSIEFAYSLIPKDPLFVPSPEALETLIATLRSERWLPAPEHFDVVIPELAHAPFSYETFDFELDDFREKSSKGQATPLDAAYWRRAMAAPSELWIHQTWLDSEPYYDDYPWAYILEHRFPLSFDYRGDSPLGYTLRVAVSDGPLFTTLGLDCPCGQSLSDAHPVFELAVADCPGCSERYKRANRPSPGWDTDDTRPAYRFAVRLLIACYDGLKSDWPDSMVPVRTRAGSRALFSDEFTAAVSGCVGAELLSFVDFV